MDKTQSNHQVEQDNQVKVSKKNDISTYSTTIKNNKIKTRMNFSSIDKLNPMEIFNSYDSDNIALYIKDKYI